MSVSRDFLEYVLDMLTPLGPIATRKMFGCVGLFVDGQMFAIVSSQERLYIKCDAQTRDRFDQAGCQPFTYTAKKPSGEHKTISLSYRAPPDCILDDQQQMLDWAQLGVQAAARVPETKQRININTTPPAATGRF